MWTLARGDEFLPGVSLRKLKGLYRVEKKAKPKLRLLCAIHRKEGKSLDNIVGLMRGIGAKNNIRQSGRPPVLSKKQMKQLVADLEQGPPRNRSGLWSTKEVRELIRKRHDIEFVPQHVYRILTSLGFSLQRPRKKHYKRASEQEIKQFKKKASDKHDTTERKGLSWASHS